jgi:hypothetical protein
VELPIFSAVKRDSLQPLASEFSCWKPVLRSRLRSDSLFDDRTIQGVYFGLRNGIDQ